MDRDEFSRVIWIDRRITLEEAKVQKLHSMKSEIVEILKGHIEIPEDDIFATWNCIDKLMNHLKSNIKI